MLIRLVFKTPFGIESQSFNFKEVCMTASTSICGIHSQYWHSILCLESREPRTKVHKFTLEIHCQYQFCDSKPSLGLNTRLEIEYQTCVLISFLLVKPRLGIEFHTPDTILLPKFTELYLPVFNLKTPIFEVCYHTFLKFDLTNF